MLSYQFCIQLYRQQVEVYPYFTPRTRGHYELLCMQWSKLTFNPLQWRLSQGIRICSIDAINAQLYPDSMDIEVSLYDIYTGSFFVCNPTLKYVTMKIWKASSHDHPSTVYLIMGYCNWNLNLWMCPDCSMHCVHHAWTICGCQWYLCMEIYFWKRLYRRSFIIIQSSSLIVA